MRAGASGLGWTIRSRRESSALLGAVAPMLSGRKLAMHGPCLWQIAGAAQPSAWSHIHIYIYIYIYIYTAVHSQKENGDLDLLMIM